MGDQGRCEQRNFCEKSKKLGGGRQVEGGGSGSGGGSGWRNEELKFLGKFTKKFGGGREGGQVGVGLVGVRVDVNAMLGVGCGVGYGRCEPRIEGIVQCTKRYCTILRKFKKIFEPKTLSMYLKKKKKKKSKEFFFDQAGI